MQDEGAVLAVRARIDVITRSVVIRTVCIRSGPNIKGQGQGRLTLGTAQGGGRLKGTFIPRRSRTVGVLTKMVLAVPATSVTTPIEKTSKERKKRGRKAELDI